MRLEFEYGQGTMAAELPESTDVFIPGVTVADPPYIPEEELEAKTLESLRNPMGMEPLSKLAKKGSKVTIVFPDRVKGGGTADFPQEGFDQTDFKRTVCGGRGEERHSFDLLQWSAQKKHGTGNTGRTRERIVRGVLVLRADH